MRRLRPLAIALLLAAFPLAVLLAQMRGEMNRQRQKRTMADIRTLATALEARATDLDTYAIGGAPAVVTPVSLDDLERALSPTYLKKLPRRDGWGHDFEVRVSATAYVIRSCGSDGRFEPPDFDAIRVNRLFSEDVVFADGNFLHYPEGSAVQ